MMKQLTQQVDQRESSHMHKKKAIVHHVDLMKEAAGLYVGG
jgi:hypothetical protein